MNRGTRPIPSGPQGSNILQLNAFIDDGFQLRESSSSSKVRPRLLSQGRVLNILLTAEPKELEKVRAQLKSRLQPKGPVGEAVLALIEHVRGSDSSEVELIFVSIFEHVVKTKERSYRKRGVCIIQLLLERDVEVADKLAAILWAHKTNNRLKLGWCIVVRDIVQAWSGEGSPDCLLHSAAFATFVSSIPQLETLARMASVQEDKKKVPTRLSIVAADCMLAITQAIAVGSITTEPENTIKENLDTVLPSKPLITPIQSRLDEVRSDTLNNSNESNAPSTSRRDIFSSSYTRSMALWEQLDNLSSLLNELYEWNYQSRAIYAKGLECVQKRLQSLAQYRDSLNNQGAEGDIYIGAEVLVACWEHYAGLLMTEDKSLFLHPQPILQHWLGALQYFMQVNDDSSTEEEGRRTQEMRRYALACLVLTLGKLDSRRLETILEEFEPQLLNVLFSQLRGGDKSIIELTVVVLRAILFRPSLSALDSVTGSSASRLETVVPMLMEMLDTRDTAARAVVLLVAEYFAANPEAVEFEKIFSRLNAEDSSQRRNALDVLTELLSICTRNAAMINSSLSRTIATHLFKTLGDSELANRVEASALFASLDPSFTLPTLVELVYSPDARIRSAASSGVLSVLKGRTDQSLVIVELLDCTAKVLKEYPIKTGHSNGSALISNNNSGASPLDVDRVMRLIPDWASKVEDWTNIIHLVLKKMFDEPANAVIPRFLSSISQQLSENTHILFPLLLRKFQEQSQLTEEFMLKISKGDSGAVANHLFQRLSPLLVLRVLLLSAFSDSSCKELYGNITSVLPANTDIYGYGYHLHTDRDDCITYHLLNRAFGALEFEDVRKVASEITARLLPKIILPQITRQLENATDSKDMLRVRACLYALCTSLVVRPKDAVNHSLMRNIRKILSFILLWPCVVEEKGFSDVANAQHGSIDCLAFMICAEMNALKESVPGEGSLGFLNTGVRTEVSQKPQKSEQPESNLSGSRPSLEIVEKDSSAKRNATPSRPFLEIVEEDSSAEGNSSQRRPLLEIVEDHSFAEENESEPLAIQGGIQLIEKLTESEQLKETRPFARKEVSLLSREITRVENSNKELSNKRIQILDRVLELELQESSDDVPKLERNSQLGRGKTEDELPDLELREEQKKEKLPAVVTQSGFKPSVLIEELPESHLSGRKSAEDGKADDHRFAVLVDVIDCLTGHVKKLPWLSQHGDFERSSLGGVSGGKVFVPIHFRICMANVLISACQKISLGSRITFAALMIPPLATFAERSDDSKLKAACLQVLFTAVYRLKASAMLPFASDLMVLSLRTVNSRGHVEERMAGAKLLASLLASEDVLIRELGPHLIEAQVVLSRISAIDSSPEMRALCEKLSSCMSMPRDGVD